MCLIIMQRLHEMPLELLGMYVPYDKCLKILRISMYFHRKVSEMLNTSTFRQGLCWRAELLLRCSSNCNAVVSFIWRMKGTATFSGQVICLLWWPRTGRRRTFGCIYYLAWGVKISVNINDIQPWFSAIFRYFNWS